MKRIFLSVLILPALASAEEIDVTIHIIGIEQQKGAVYAGLFDAETWSGDRRLATAKADIAGNEATLHLAAPHPGTYAIKMFHDLNGNGVLDKTFGVPDEPYAFSNDAKAGFGPPKFTAAAFEVTEQGAQVTITLR